MITRLLIANRGEIAVRIARTARALGITTVAVHADPDADALHVQACDEAVALGGTTPATSYLRGDAIIEAALLTGADAVHPGYGFLAENADFAAAVAEAGLTWVGPSPQAIRAMGDKLQAKRMMADAGVPLVPGEELAADASDEDVAAAGKRVGLPIMVKAAAGGGGKGMRLVQAEADLVEAVAAAGREALAAFGDGRVFLERALRRPRHVEVQVLADDHGNVVHLFERECSIQRRHQKIVEETPSPALDDDLRGRMGDAAVRAARAIDYTGAGTVEFLLDSGGEFHFLEMNTRLQVEHPVTEEVVRVRRPDGVARVDLVAEQLRVAEGQALTFAQDDLFQVGHAIEVRLYAEDPGNQFLPAAGRLDVFEVDAVEGIRVDTGVRSGDVISTHFDPMVAKVIAHGATREEAARLLARGLTDLPLGGSTTNRDFLVAVLRDDAYLAGDTTTAFIDERFPTDDDRRPTPPDHARVAAIGAVATLELLDARAAGPVPGVGIGFSNTGLDPERVVFAIAGDDQHLGVTVAETRDGGLDVRLDGDIQVTSWVVDHGHEPTTTPGLRHRWLVARVDGYATRIDVWSTDDRHHVRTPWGMVALTQQPRFPDASAEDVPGATRAPMPGAVVSVAVEAGADVAAGDLLVVLEAMKMEHRLTAPFDGVVAAVEVAAGDQVDADQVLVVVEAGDATE